MRVPSWILTAAPPRRACAGRFKYITFKIEGSEVVPAEKIASADFDEFVGNLKEDEPRFCVLDFAYQTTDGRPSDKVVFVSW